MAVSRGKPLDIKKSRKSGNSCGVEKSKCALAAYTILKLAYLVYQARLLFARVSGICSEIIFAERRWQHEERF